MFSTLSTLEVGYGREFLIAFIATGVITGDNLFSTVDPVVKWAERGTELLERSPRQTTAESGWLPRTRGFSRVVCGVVLCFKSALDAVPRRAVSAPGRRRRYPVSNPRKRDARLLVAACHDSDERRINRLPSTREGLCH